MSLFENTKPTITPEQRVVSQIDWQLRQSAQSLLRTYNQIRRLVYANPELTPLQVYTAFATLTTTGMTPDDLGKSARATKCICNLFSHDPIIVDEVPQATISFDTPSVSGVSGYSGLTP